MSKWLLLITSLATENATLRMRLWRALKALGAAVLRDGVYLMPADDASRQTLQNIAAEVQDAGGVAWVLPTQSDDNSQFQVLFDRTDDYAALLADIDHIRGRLSIDTVVESTKQVRKLRKALNQIIAIDFFAGEAQRQTDKALIELELLIARSLSPDEPHFADKSISSLTIADYQGQVWATRCRPWVDRLACAWLIRRFIDPQAQLLWLAAAADCPKNALGFDFDGARFSHSQGLVSFEVLLASFNLQQPGLKRLAALVHFLDVGGVPVPEAVGIECVLAGLRANISDDHQLLVAASAVFDSLLVSFEQGRGNE